MDKQWKGDDPTYSRTLSLLYSSKTMKYSLNDFMFNPRACKSESPAGSSTVRGAVTFDQEAFFAVFVSLLQTKQNTCEVHGVQ